MLQKAKEISNYSALSYYRHYSLNDSARTGVYCGFTAFFHLVEPLNIRDAASIADSLVLLYKRTKSAVAVTENRNRVEIRIYKRNVHFRSGVEIAEYSVDCRFIQKIRPLSFCFEQYFSIGRGFFQGLYEIKINFALLISQTLRSAKSL